MTREDEIRSMYREIVEYSGNFGDPICDTYSFDPWQIIACSDLTDFERRGALVAMLVDLMTAIDNSTHENVVSGERGSKARRILDRKFVERFPLVENALAAFFQSEEAFSLALEPIFLEWILPVAGIHDESG